MHSIAALVWNECTVTVMLWP